jgi:hypothetical protein
VVKLEVLNPASYREFKSLMEGKRILIDLTGNDEEDVAMDSLQASLADNFLAPIPSAAVDVPLKRTYRLADQSISESLKDQCIGFGEWRSALWNWSREGAGVCPTTHDGNISNLLLFAGYATKHAPNRQRITPPQSFDLSVIFASQAVLEPLVCGYLRWLRRKRRVMFSTCLGYLNSLCVFANYYYADQTNASFDAGTEQAVKSGLRRVRSQADAAAQKERKHKPIHPQWLSWRACQFSRRRAARAYLKRKRGHEGEQLAKLYARLETRRQQGQATKADAMQILRHPLYVCLQQLVCLYLHTITPPVRVSIVRQLEFKTTFVKLRQDPSRYVIDLKNNPHSPSARHKTASYYRKAILPQPNIERITEFVDQLRAYKLNPELKKAKRCVFVDSTGKPFSQSGWTAFVKRSWGDFARPPSSDDEPAGPSRQPPPSLTRTMFVTWLNSVPYNQRDEAFLDKIQQTAADFQTHTLQTANSLYDKDTASYERLLAVTQFCEQWALSVGGQALGDSKWDNNLDSDDDFFDSTNPVPRRERVAAFPPVLEVKTNEIDHSEDEMDIDEMETEPSPSDQVDGAVDESRLNEEDAPLSSEEKLYQPEAILARHTEMVYKKKKGRYGKTHKKVIGWVDRLLVKWEGYSLAEATWESDIKFYAKYCAPIIAHREETEVPEALVRKTKHPQTGAAYYQVRWKDSQHSTMELASAVEGSKKYRYVWRTFSQTSSSSSSSSTNSNSNSSSSSSSISSISSSNSIPQRDGTP